MKTQELFSRTPETLNRAIFFAALSSIRDHGFQAKAVPFIFLENEGFFGRLIIGKAFWEFCTQYLRVVENPREFCAVGYPGGR